MIDPRVFIVPYALAGLKNELRASDFPHDAIAQNMATVANIADTKLAIR